MFEKLNWEPDRMLLDDLVFRLEHSANGNWDLGDNCFRFYKTKGLIEQYKKYWSLINDFVPKNVFELGVWDGGSAAFWFEHLHPDKHVAIDLQSRENSAYFQRYVISRGLAQRIKIYWGVNQADGQSIKDIVKTEFSGPLDLIIDDASHLYIPTKASFEILFPLLRPKGIYIIEDWAWAHWQGLQIGSGDDELTNLVCELVEATGSSTELIASLIIFQGFIVVERGTIDLKSDTFKISNHIYRHSRSNSSKDY